MSYLTLVFDVGLIPFSLLSFGSFCRDNFGWRVSACQGMFWPGVGLPVEVVFAVFPEITPLKSFRQGDMVNYEC